MFQTDCENLFSTFPHLKDPITLLWGHKELNDYLNNLLFDTRDGTCKGFPAHHAATIHKVLHEHQEAFPHLGKPSCIWAQQHLK